MRISELDEVEREILLGLTDNRPPLTNLKHLARAHTVVIDTASPEIDDTATLTPYSPNNPLSGKSTREIIRDKVRSMSIPEPDSIDLDQEDTP